MGEVKHMKNKIASTSNSPILSGPPEANILYMKELLIVAGLRQTDIAHELGVKKSIVNKVILRKENSIVR